MRFEIDADAKVIEKSKIQRIALESQIILGGKNSNSNIQMRKKRHGANGAEGGNVRTLTAAEELGRRETMDDGQGLEKGKLEERGVKGGAHLCSSLGGVLKLRVREEKVEG